MCSPVGAGAIAAAGDDVEIMFVFTQQYAGGAPAGRDEPGGPAGREVDDGDGVEAKQGDIECLLIFAQGQSEGEQATVAVDGRVDVDGDGSGDAVIAVVDDGDIIVCGVGHIGEAAADRQGVRAGAPYYLGAFHQLTDLVAGFVAIGDGVGGQVDGIDAHGFGGEGV